jgi:hypothetical protein
MDKPATTYDKPIQMDCIDETPQEKNKARDQVNFVDVDGNDILKRRC